MFEFKLLEPGCYYVVQEKQDGPLSLMKVQMVTDHCVLLIHYGPDFELQEWRRKNDMLHDIIECLDDAKANMWRSFYRNPSEFDFETDDEDDDKM